MAPNFGFPVSAVQGVHRPSFMPDGVKGKDEAYLLGQNPSQDTGTEAQKLIYWQKTMSQALNFLIITANMN